MRYIKVLFLFTVFIFSAKYINAQPCISLSSPNGTDDQKVCVNSTIVNIVYELNPGVISATVTGLPAGVIGTYIPGFFTISGTPTAAGIFNYTITTTGICPGSGIATGRITVNALPAATAGNNGPVCTGSLLSLTGGPAGMTYFWSGPNGFSSLQQSPVVSPAATMAMAGVYTLIVTNSNNCINSATTTVVVNASPVATAANNGPVCPGTALTLTGGPVGMIAYSWSGPNGYSNATMSPTVSASATPAMAGVYSLTVTNSSACQNTASTTVVVRIPPAATASNNGPVCAGTPLVLTGGPGGMATYSWTGPNSFVSPLQSPQVSASATIAMAGTYSLTVTDINGCKSTATTVVTVNTLPLATALNNGPVCSGKPLILTGGPAGMTTYLWTGPSGYTSGLQSPTVSTAATVAMAGIYTLSVTDGFGCHNIATTTVTVNQSPIATALNNGPVCVGSPLTLTGGPATMTTYAWTGPNSFTSPLMSPTVSPSATLAMAGIYILNVTNSTGCQDTASTRVNVFTVPVSNAGLGGTECDLNFNLNAIPSVGLGLWTIVTGPGIATFSPNANTPTAIVTVTAYGSYSFRWTETNGPCTSSSVVTVNFYQQPVANAGPGGDACSLTFSLNAVPTSGTGTWTMTSGTGTSTFSPNANSPTATVEVTQYGTKQFTWTVTNGICQASSSVTVNFYQQPSANAGPGGNNCGIDFNLRAVPSIGTGTWTLDSGPGNATFSPDPNTPAAVVTISAYGTYLFRWTEVNGSCSSSATVSVTFLQQPSANGGVGGDECDLNFVLNAVPGSGTGTWSKISGPGNTVFSPGPNQYNAVVTVSQFGSYDLAWTEVNNQCSSSDIIRVTFHDLPAVNAGTDILLCKGRNIQLSASGTGTFQWSPVNGLNNPYINNPVASPEATTTYTVTLTDQYGCKNSDQLNVEVRDQPIANAGPDQELHYVFSTNFEATPPGTNQTGTWTILSGEGNITDLESPSSQVSDLGLEINSFIWTVTNGICPVSSDTMNIKVNNLIIPSLITPNLDGINDYFVILGLESFGTTSLIVFNRWGSRVYENDDYDNSWYGIDENENPLPEDTYFYILKPEKSITIKGFVVIAR